MSKSMQASFPIFMFYKIEDGEFIYEPLMHQEMLQKLNDNPDELKTKYHIGITILHVTRDNIFSWFPNRGAIATLLQIFETVRKYEFENNHDELIKSIIHNTKYFITLVNENKDATSKTQLKIKNEEEKQIKNIGVLEIQIRVKAAYLLSDIMQKKDGCKHPHYINTSTYTERLDEANKELQYSTKSPEEKQAGQTFVNEKNTAAAATKPTTGPGSTPGSGTSTKPGPGSTSGSGTSTKLTTIPGSTSGSAAAAAAAAAGSGTETTTTETGSTPEPRAAAPTIVSIPVYIKVTKSTSPSKWDTVVYNTPKTTESTTGGTPKPGATPTTTGAELTGGTPEPGGAPEPAAEPKPEPNPEPKPEPNPEPEPDDTKTGRVYSYDSVNDTIRIFKIEDDKQYGTLKEDTIYIAAGNIEVEKGDKIKYKEHTEVIEKNIIHKGGITELRNIKGKWVSMSKETKQPSYGLIYKIEVIDDGEKATYAYIDADYISRHFYTDTLDSTYREEGHFDEGKYFTYVMQKLKTGGNIPVKFRPIAEGEVVPEYIKTKLNEAKPAEAKPGAKPGAEPGPGDAPPPEAAAGDAPPPGAEAKPEAEPEPEAGAGDAPPIDESYKYKYIFYFIEDYLNKNTNTLSTKDQNSLKIILTRYKVVFSTPEAFNSKNIKTEAAETLIKATKAIIGQIYEAHPTLWTTNDKVFSYINWLVSIGKLGDDTPEKTYYELNKNNYNLYTSLGQQEANTPEYKEDIAQYEKNLEEIKRRDDTIYKNNKEYLP